MQAIYIQYTPRSFSIRHSAACRSAIRSDRVVVARARKSDTGGPGQSCWKRSAVNRSGGYHFPLSALGILNDYALYKSTHSLTHSLSPISLPSPFLHLPSSPLSSPLEVGPLIELGCLVERCKLPQQSPGRPYISAQFQLKRWRLVALKSEGTVPPTLQSGGTRTHRTP